MTHWKFLDIHELSYEGVSGILFTSQCKGTKPDKFLLLSFTSVSLRHTCNTITQLQVFRYLYFPKY